MAIFQKSIKYRESYITTLARLFEYSTTVYKDNLVSKMPDSDQVYTYGTFREKCYEISQLLCRYGIGGGDKVAIVSQNMPNWSIAMFSTVTFGRIFVPILPDSSTNEITNILNHSETKVLFVSQRMLPKISEECLNKMTLVFNVETLEIIKRDNDAFTCDGRTLDPLPDDIACLIYTSGTTGKAKGVMLSHRNFCANIFSSYFAHKANHRDVWLSILPMAHTYELSIGMLYPFSVGACVVYMKKPPTPTILLKMMQDIRPTIILSVPLIMEKIYKGSILPTIARSKVLTWLQKHMPKLLYSLIGAKLRKMFGGRLVFFGVGGSKLNPTVEEFLYKAKFPYAIGYGLTETAPLICGCEKKTRKIGFTGPAVHRVTVKLINVNPATDEGELVCKGPNVMLGYYKDAARTREVFTEDGWFKTNDLAIVDENGKYSIIGRKSNVILGASGENIYPEEIEDVINNMSGIAESLVMEKDGKLVALVHIDENILNWNQEGEDEFLKKVEDIKESVLSFVNKRVNKSSKVQNVEIVKDFEKTATHKIRRSVYKNKDVEESGEKTSNNQTSQSLENQE